LRFRSEQHRAARSQPIECREWHDLREALAEANDLRRDFLAVARFEQETITHRYMAAESVDIDDESGQSDYAPFEPLRHDVAQSGAATGASLQEGSRRSHESLLQN
jgi:hypothetical protein